MKIIINGFGETLGVEKDSFAIKTNGETIKRIPFYKTNEIMITSKNLVSVDALLWASLYNVDVVFCMHNGKPLAFLHPINDKANVKTRINQLKAYESRKGVELAKAILTQKIENENKLLKHYNLKTYETNPKLPKIEQIQKINAERITQNLRLKLQTMEERFSRHLYAKVFPLFPKWLRTDKRIHRNATEPLNNLLNLSFKILEWKMMKAVIKAKMEPYLGYIHSIQHAKPSLVLDLIEPFRTYIIHFLIQYSKTLKQKDFQRVYIPNQYPRYFLKHETTWKLIESLNKHLFEAYIPIQRNRKHGFRMKFETFLDEYASSIASYLNTPNTSPPNPQHPPLNPFHLNA
ncbi:MAG: CRISPR-associated endonuclease Cas1 [Candidatus Jordarchaeales archaeon]